MGVWSCDVTRAVLVTSLSLVWFLIDTKSQVSAEISDSIVSPSDETVNSDKVEIICDCFKQLHSHHGSPSIFPIIGPGLCLWWDVHSLELKPNDSLNKSAQYGPDTNMETQHPARSALTALLNIRQGHKTFYSSGQAEAATVTWRYLSTFWY